MQKGLKIFRKLSLLFQTPHPIHLIIFYLFRKYQFIFAHIIEGKIKIQS